MNLTLTRQTIKAIADARDLRPVVMSLIAVELTAALACAVAAGAGSEYVGFAALGLAMTAVVQVPLMLRSQPFFSLWGLAVFVVGVGAGIRSIYLATGYPDRQFLDSFFLRGHSFDELLPAGLVALLGLTAFTAGYIRGSDRQLWPGQGFLGKIGSAVRLDLGEVSEKAIVRIAVAYLVVGVTATGYYFHAVGGLGARISQRRGMVAEDGSTTGTFGYVEFAAGASLAGAFLLLVYWLATRRSVGVRRWTALALSFSAGFSINVITTARADLLWVTAAAVAALVILRGRISVSVLLSLGFVILLGIGGLSVMRSTAADEISVASAWNDAVLNRNAYDLGKTLLVIEAVPETLNYQYGATVGRYLVSPVPRSWWPEKPVISPGRTIGREVYGNETSGVPPGLNGEVVWNFGPVGGVVFASMLGLLVGVMHRRLYPRRRDDVLGSLIYVFVAFTAAKSLLATTIGTTAVELLGDALLLVPMMLWIWLRNRRKLLMSAADPLGPGDGWRTAMKAARSRGLRPLRNSTLSKDHN